MIVSSPAIRAHSTAKAIAAALKYPLEFLQLEEGLYLAGPDGIMEIIEQQRDDFSDLMIVGHNPGMTDLINQLLPELELDNLPTGGVVATESDADCWARFGDGQVRLVYYDYPKNPEVLVIEY